MLSVIDTAKDEVVKSVGPIIGVIQPLTINGAGTLAFHNTLSRKKEAFVPLHADRVGLYVCGPTVYDYAHIGNARPVVVFDVLRATTTMAAALAAGIREIRIYGSTTAARVGAVGNESLLLCGEEKCLPPRGFHLGNSPGAFSSQLHRDRVICMSTTNGTRAILAASDAHRIFTGALVNVDGGTDF